MKFAKYDSSTIISEQQPEAAAKKHTHTPHRHTTHMRPDKRRAKERVVNQMLLDDGERKTIDVRAQLASNVTNINHYYYSLLTSLCFYCTHHRIVIL